MEYENKFVGMMDVDTFETVQRMLNEGFAYSLLPGDVWYN